MGDSSLEIISLLSIYLSNEFLIQEGLYIFELYQFVL